MKTSNPNNIMTTSLISALMLASCNITPEPSPIIEKSIPLIINENTKTVYNKYSTDKLIVVSDTTIEYSETKLHTPPTKEPDLTNLRNDKNAGNKSVELNFVTIGGSFSAGVRDGGLRLDGQMTSFPNLIARQMLLKSFSQPLFTREEYNGFGFKVISKSNITETNIPKYSVVKNNNALYTDEGNGIVFNKFEGKNNNLGVPTQKLYQGQTFYELTTNFIDRSYTKRISDKPMIEKLFETKADFFLFELGMQNIIDYIYTKKDFFPSDLNFFIDDYWYKNISDAGFKGCFANVPNPVEFPLFKLVTTEQLKEANEAKPIYYAFSSGTGNLSTLKTGYKFIPTSSIDSLLSRKVPQSQKKGLIVTKILNENDVIDNVEILEINGKVTQLNEKISSIGSKYKYPIVDLFTLYKKINAGDYVTDDGVRVDISFPNGNFYSSDGINPTPFGQSIIANEFIKTINQSYKTNIELIKTSEYLKK